MSVCCVCTFDNYPQPDFAVIDKIIDSNESVNDDDILTFKDDTLLYMAKKSYDFSRHTFNKGDTLFHVRYKPKTLKYLVDKNLFDLYTKNESGRTVFHNIIYYYETFRDIEYQKVLDNEGNTPLHIINADFLFLEPYWCVDIISRFMKRNQLNNKGKNILYNRPFSIGLLPFYYHFINYICDEKLHYLIDQGEDGPTKKIFKRLAVLDFSNYLSDKEINRLAKEIE